MRAIISFIQALLKVHRQLMDAVIEISIEETPKAVIMLYNAVK